MSPINNTFTQKKVIFLIGLPGSGKTTVAHMLSQKHDFQILSGGKIFRKKMMSKHCDQDGKIAKEIILKGVGAPDELMIRLFQEELEKQTYKKIVFDGNPKDVDQFQKIINLVGKFGFQESDLFLVWLDMSEAKVLERIKRRMFCIDCGQLCNIEDIKCSNCDGRITRRYDDSIPEAIRTKVNWFKDDVQPIFFHYKNIISSLKINPRLTLEEKINTIINSINNPTLST